MIAIFAGTLLMIGLVLLLAQIVLTARGVLQPAKPVAITLNGTVIAPLGVPLAGFKNGSPPLTSLNNTRREEIAANVLDNLARIVRKDATLNARIHTIGYQGTGAILTDVMQRVANCDGCPNVAAADAADPTQKKGRFVAATTADELLTAFLDVAGFIGRITK